MIEIGDDSEGTGYVKLIASRTFEVLHTFKLAPTEVPFSIVSAEFSSDPASYYCVGASEDPRAFILLTDA